MADGDVQFEVREGTGYLRLMRPTALNALSPQMIAVITEQLSAWRDDASVQALDISGEGRAYCAGADVRWMRSTMIENGVQSALEFLADEYAMDAVVAQFGKPVTTHLHGVAMGRTGIGHARGHPRGHRRPGDGDARGGHWAVARRRNAVRVLATAGRDRHVAGPDRAHDRCEHGAGSGPGRPG